jgi:hypothetical protein
MLQTFWILLTSLVHECPLLVTAVTHLQSLKLPQPIPADPSTSGDRPLLRKQSFVAILSDGRYRPMADEIQFHQEWRFHLICRHGQRKQQ